MTIVTGRRSDGMHYHLYVLVYKLTYIVAVVMNLALLCRVGDGNVTPIMTEFYVITSAILAVNVAGGVGLAMHKHIAVVFEQLFSLCRMFTIVVASTVALAGLLAYSPTFYVVWRPIFTIAQTWLGWLWLCCLALLLLEILYFRSVRLYGTRLARAQPRADR